MKPKWQTPFSLFPYQQRPAANLALQGASPSQASLTRPEDRNQVLMADRETSSLLGDTHSNGEHASVRQTEHQVDKAQGGPERVRPEGDDDSTHAHI